MNIKNFHYFVPRDPAIFEISVFGARLRKQPNNQTCERSGIIIRFELIGYSVKGW